MAARRSGARAGGRTRGRETGRNRGGRATGGDWLRGSYALAWANALNFALRDVAETTDPDTIQALLGAIAIAKRSFRLGALISHLDTSELNEIVEKYYAWSE